MGNWDGTVIVTGGAGFIGSCLVRKLNEQGIDDIIIVDNIAATEKWRNLNNKTYREYIHKDQFLLKLKNGGYLNVGGILHMGACSSTIEKNFDYLWQNNVEYSKTLWDYCAEARIPFLYASSAATYGDGKRGFDDKTEIGRLRPLNGYGYSKKAFDQWSQKQKHSPAQHVGFRFFNVYGPNEYFKGSMASMAYHGFKQITEHEKTIRLFKSENPGYDDGGQMRDFVYVKDICDVIWFFMKNPEYNGIFNIGTGRAQTFKELADAIFHALGLKPNIEYIDMPEAIKSNYQYYTQADLSELRKTGYDGTFRDVEQGVYEYVTEYLSQQYKIY
ncbi:MAG: ADP-glyceromanno-heptose 6-epimerase [Hungatella sp.]|jgi:ADP-L-glycero-D-manno-heptose 6-epimerase|nr:ADP-glyceromanno-heptose 6-epimerase [Hungatella sp.]